MAWVVLSLPAMKAAGVAARQHAPAALRGQRARLAVAGLALAVACAAAFAPARAAPPAYWKDSGYGYDARKTPLRKVLQDFAQSNNLTLNMSGTFNTPVNGRLQGATLTDFIERLALQQRFQWFVYGSTLYVSPLTDVAEERLEVGQDAVESVRPALTGLGLFEPRFGWGELPEEGVITVRGPREYVRLVKQSVRPERKREEPEPMVFRLRFAAVDDRTVTIREQTLTTPGVASLLKSILAVRESRQPTRTLLTDLQRQELPIPPPMNFGANAGGGGGSGGGSTLGPLAGRRQAVGGSAANVGPGVAVEGDVRTNTIVIFDVPSKRAYYQRLIDALDTPQRLVEIEAYIIDVNRERVAELGVDLAAGSSRGAGAVSAAAALARGSLTGTTLVLQGLQNFFARLRAMEVSGDARVLAKPSISTLENLVAVLDLSQTVYIKSTGERVASVTPVTAGTLLRVTPRVVDTGADMQVHLTVDIEDGRVANPLSASQTPEVLRSNISTQAMLQNEESLIIGGYNIDSSAQSTSAVPGASRVPLFGGLFTSTQETHTSRQRLFIITPRVVASAHDRRRRDEAMREREIDGVAATRAQRELGVQWLPPDAPPAEYDVRVRGHN